MFMEHDLGLWVWKEYGRNFTDRVKKKKRGASDRGVFGEASEDRQAHRYLEDRDIFNFPA
jgi:hypothetical protein